MCFFQAGAGVLAVVSGGTVADGAAMDMAMEELSDRDEATDEMRVDIDSIEAARGRFGSRPGMSIGFVTLEWLATTAESLDMSSVIAVSSDPLDSKCDK